MSGETTKTLFETRTTGRSSYNHVIRVVFDSAADAAFDYLVPDNLWPVRPGERVEVPFGRGNKRQVGFCVAADVPLEKSFGGGNRRRLKEVIRKVDDEPLLDGELLKLGEWISSYYVCPLGQVLAAMVPGAVKKAAGVRRELYVYLCAELPCTQGQALAATAKKQRRLVEYLRETGAFDAASAVSVEAALAAVGCTKVPLKRLAEKQIVSLITRTKLKSLPVLPEGIAIKQSRVTLNEDQKKAMDHLAAQIDSGRFGVTVLHGVTDSGKTELYILAVERVLARGKTAIVLLPEIALTAQTVQRFSGRFERVAVMHSGLGPAERNAQWQKIKRGQADVVIGARSAVFAPVPRLGLVVVDEEHEPSYKQDTAPRYNGRDVAIKRAQLAGAHCILGSATVSLEMIHNCRTKKHFQMVRLPRRVMNLPMPQMKLVDMRQYCARPGVVELISPQLQQHLGEALARREQAILLLNRRGYSNFVFCSSCHYTLHCRNCDVTLTFHKAKMGQSRHANVPQDKHIGSGYAVCHYCLARTLVPRACPLCGKAMVMIGTGSQRLEEELAAKFPDARVARVDSDSMAARDYYRVLSAFSSGRIDILAGTQMLAKGLHFPNVTVVGVISADTSLYVPDFRANERTFQLVSQVAGRAGRSAKKGTVLVQTFLPDQPAIRFAIANDYTGFINEELKHRKACNLPPFWRLAAVTMRDRSYEKLEAAGRAIRERIDRVVQQEKLKVLVRGPMPAVISRIQRFHRLQIIIQAPTAQMMNRLFSVLRSQGPVRPAVKVAVDIDPVNLL